MTKRPENLFSQYHAHVYFDGGTVRFASRLCEEAGVKYGVQVGRVHRKPVGPHPSWSCQLVFSYTQFEALVPWLDESRHGLTILIHPVTGNDLEDHTIHAAWLGDEVMLNIAMFQPDDGPGS